MAKEGLIHVVMRRFTCMCDGVNPASYHGRSVKDNSKLKLEDKHNMLTRRYGMPIGGRRRLQNATYSLYNDGTPYTERSAGDDTGQNSSLQGLSRPKGGSNLTLTLKWLV